MRKLTICVLSLALLLPAPAYSYTFYKTEKYNDQKLGQVCAKKSGVNLIRNRQVTLPDTTVLVCKNDGEKYRWKHKGHM